MVMTMVNLIVITISVNLWLICGYDYGESDSYSYQRQSMVNLWLIYGYDYGQSDSYSYQCQSMVNLWL